MAKASKLREIAAARGQPVPELLKALYDLYGSQRVVAHVLGVSPATVSTHLKIYRLKEHTVLREEKAS